MAYAIVSFNDDDDVESTLARGLTDPEAGVMLMCGRTRFDTIDRLAVALLNHSCRKPWEWFLPDCELESVPDSVWDVTDVNSLLFCRNNLRTISPRIGKFKDSLTQLYLNDNPLCVFPEAVCQLECLKVLVVSNCRLHSLPLSFARLRSLERLIIDDNHFHAFPEVICELKHLEVLEMNNANLSDIHASVAQLQQLRVLNLERNRFRKFPIAVCKLLNLRRLDISYNQLTEWPLAITSLVNLTMCAAWGNEFTHTPSFLGGLPRLSFIGTSGKSESSRERARVC